MSKSFILILLLISIVLKAEVTKLDSIFMELDHTQMHTKFLWDKQKRHIDPMFLSGNVNNDTLEKIEEPTLYVIQLKKENDAIKQELNTIKQGE